LDGAGNETERVSSHLADALLRSHYSLDFILEDLQLGA
jgi:hypothetical protein